MDGLSCLYPSRDNEHFLVKSCNFSKYNLISLNVRWFILKLVDYIVVMLVSELKMYISISSNRAKIFSNGSKADLFNNG